MATLIAAGPQDEGCSHRYRVQLLNQKTPKTNCVERPDSARQWGEQTHEPLQYMPWRACQWGCIKCHGRAQHEALTAERQITK